MIVAGCVLIVVIAGVWLVREVMAMRSIIEHKRKSLVEPPPKTVSQSLRELNVSPYVVLRDTFVLTDDQTPVVLQPGDLVILPDDPMTLDLVAQGDIRLATPRQDANDFRPEIMLDRYVWPKSRPIGCRWPAYHIEQRA